MFCYHRNEPIHFRSKLEKWLNVLRLLWAADDYIGVALYRVRTSLRAARVPILPRILHLVNILVFGIRIGDHVVVKEGVYIPHGQVVIDGMVLVGRGCFLGPWTTLGVVQGNPLGPQLDDGVFVGTGAKILGPVHVGADSRIGANSLVLQDVPPNATVGGVPARVLKGGPSEEA